MVFKKKIILHLLFFGIFLFSLILVVAQTPTEVIFDPIRDLFTNSQEGDLSENVAKYLFFILLAILVWSTIDMSGMIENDLIKWIASLIVAFLGVAYLTPPDIWTLLASYEALGLTLLFILPSLILVFFTYRIAAVGGAGGVVAQHIIWFIYFIFLVWKFITGIINGQISPNNSITWVFVGILILAGLAALFNKLFIKWFGKEVLEAQSQSAGSVLKRAIALRKMEAEALGEQAG